MAPGLLAWLGEIGVLMKELLTSLMLWIAANSPLAVPETLPNVIRLDPVQLACILEYVVPCDESKLDPSWTWYAYYKPKDPLSSARIIISEDVDLSGLEGHSVLLHELVHHMQVTAGQEYNIECQAYQLEQKWLEERGTSLQEVFGMGDIFVLLQMSCYEP